MTYPVELPSSVPAPPDDSDGNFSEYNLSKWFSYEKRWKVRFSRIPGNYTEQHPGQGFRQIKGPFEFKWNNVPAHPHVGRIKFSSVDGMRGSVQGRSTVVIVTDLYPEGNILAVLARKGVTVVQKMTWSLQICKAVKHLHQFGIVHGNIHPRNALIAGDGSAILTDACIYTLIAEHIMSKLSDDDKYKLKHPETLACKTHSVITAYDHVIPKMKPTRRDDLFALAYTLYAVFEGREPWSGRQIFIKATNWGHRNLDKPSDMNEGLWRVIHGVFESSDSGEGCESQILQDMMRHLSI